jgi:hypothetical protein
MLFFPSSNTIGQRSCILGPVVKGGRIEVGAVWPNERMGLWVYSNLIKECEFSQGSEQFSTEHRTKIDGLLRSIVETHPQDVSGNDLEFHHTIDSMPHHLIPNEVVQ